MDSNVTYQTTDIKKESVKLRSQINQQFIKNVRFLLHEQNMSVKQLALHCAMDQSALNKQLNSISISKIETYARIAIVLRYDLEELMFRDITKRE